MKRKELSSDKLQQKDTITVSVPDGATVAIGQVFVSDITYSSSSGNLSTNFDINVTPLSQAGMTITEISKTPPGNKYFTLKIRCIINSSLSENTNLIYTIQYGNKKDTPETKKITYTAKELGKYSLQLKTNQSMCLTPNESDGSFNNSVGSYIKYSTRLVGKNSGDPFKYTPLNVFSIVPNDIDNKNGKVYITTDPDEGVATLLSPDNSGSHLMYPLSTNKDGYVSFRVYPRKNTPVSLTLASEILGLGPIGGPLDTVTAATYIITPPPAYNENPLFSPNIQTPYGDIVIGEDGQDTFKAEIMPYDNLRPNDNILFFTNGGTPAPDGLVLPIKSLLEVGLDSNNNYLFDIPYSMFQQNVLSYLYYAVSSGVAGVRYSGAEAFTYKGGGDKKTCKLC